MSNRRDLLERHIGWNPISRHDLLHVACVFSDIVLIILAGVVDPLGIIFVEVTLVVSRKPPLPLPIRATRILPISRLRILRQRRQG